MTSPTDSAVAVYLDFDNIVISRYDQVHGKQAFWKDRDAGFDEAKLRQAEIDVHAILDYASSFGRLALTRAYADWSMPFNVRYKKQLVDRAIDLVQLFPASGSKNGADIRLAVDALEDMGRMPQVGTVVLAAGDSDYIPLAQRLKRMGRYVVAVGVAGATSRSLAAACDELLTYDNLPGLTQNGDDEEVEQASPRAPKKSARRGTRKSGSPKTETETETEASAETSKSTKSIEIPVSTEPMLQPIFVPAGGTQDDEDDEQALARQATRLLLRALRLLGEKDPEEEWTHSGTVKSQMKRMDSSFNEKELGFKTFTDFLKSRNSVVEVDEDNQTRKVRLRPGH
ncbi:NYN domain-containing protein [Aeromicrobium duanguangcaii]|uniref:NYN domain-containing protein n=1 Tax=Aeromicrobium duanguangcaii TaxID=2968086 RepID=A0ABY5KER3_9ACTN|nr:NYN domain-containing protein [Aeromicrobium duanguangcaii]MCD9154655.1 NYN domain-containing protein [Aeromicrobium duanguangcaii]UUI67931.1 NYN domain-containing protein [Aeromicrobium duanguangcaii]